ncbi:ABC transporter permease [Candidatus Saccharibacteria bacterium]|nr:ABC transporter permease [Candidatus Saccharibacteria bacterium]
MQQFFTVFKYEFKKIVLSKGYLISTGIMAIILAGVFFLPQLISDLKLFNSDNNTPVALIKTDYTKSETLVQTIHAALPDYEVKLTDKSTEEAKQEVIDDKAKFFIEANHNLTEVTEYSKIGFSDASIREVQSIDAIVKNLRQSDLLAEQNLAPAAITKVLNPDVKINLETVNKNGAASVIYTFVLIYALYMAITFYGSHVMNSVVTEKTSRAMEVLATSVKPNALLFGKIISTSLAGLIQIAAIIIEAFICVKISSANNSSFPVNQIISNIPTQILIYMLVFFLLGFLIYSFLYGAFASTVSKIDELGSAIMPVQIIIVFTFIVTMSTINSGNADTPFNVFLSYFPFTAPMMMFTRAIISNISTLEIILSILVLIVSTYFIGWLSARIYRVGILMYGEKPNFIKLMAAIFKKQ